MLLFMDGFDTKDAATKWTGGGFIAGYSSSTRLGSGFAVAFSNETLFLKVPFAAASQVYVGFAWRQDVNDTNMGTPFFALYGDTGATMHMNLRLNGTGLVLFRGGTQLVTVPGVLLATTWNYIEIGTDVNAGAGNCIVRVNGTTVINYSGATKSGGTNNTVDTLYIGGLPGAGASTSFFDDIYIANNSGAVNNNFLGDVRVQTLTPNGAGSSTGLTPTGSGTNYLNVNEIPDSTATFNGSATSGTRDTYALTDLTAGTATVLAVQQVMSAFKSDSGAASMKNAQKSGATVSYGASHSLGTSPALYLDVFETNPATSAAWTPSDVNALEAGAEVV